MLERSFVYSRQPLSSTAWTPGQESFALPDFLGFALLGESRLSVFVLDVHYDNPHKDAGVMDNSGIELFYTTQPRQYHLSVLFLGGKSHLIPNIA